MLRTSVKVEGLAIGAILVLLTACADGVNFKERNSTKSLEQSTIEGPNTPVGQEGHSEDPGEGSPEMQANNPEVMDPSAPQNPAVTNDPVLSECAKKWVKHPFTSEELAKPKVVDINSDVANNALLYSDTVTTAKPTLYLINFDVNVGNQGIFALKNEKGWYCLNMKAKVINNFRLELGCTTQLAIVTQNTRNDNNFQEVRDICP